MFCLASNSLLLQLKLLLGGIEKEYYFICSLLGNLFRTYILLEKICTSGCKKLNQFIFQRFCLIAAETTDDNISDNMKNCFDYNLKGL